MKKKAIPAIHVPIQNADGSMQWVWYMFFQWIAENAGAADLSDYFTKEEVEELLSVKLDKTTDSNILYGTDNDGEQHLYNVSDFPLDENVVHKTGNETIEDVKTFTGTINSRVTNLTAQNPNAPLEGGELNFEAGSGEPNVGKPMYIDRYNGNLRMIGVSSSGTVQEMFYANAQTGYTSLKTPTDANLESQVAPTTEWVHNHERLYVTNCITKIPQDVQLEINASNEFVIKSGSKVYYGDGSYTVLSGDKKWNIATSWGDQPFVFFIKKSGATIDQATLANTSSNSSNPGTGYRYWFNTTDKKCYINDGSGVASEASFPVGIVQHANGVGWININQVFNGFGYVGSTMYVLPGVQVLIPNGRNSDGTLKNTSLTKQSVNVFTPSSATFSQVTNIALGGTLSYHTFTYDEVNNKTSAPGYMNAGDVTWANGKITSFVPKTAFRAVDYNDYQKTVSQVDTNTANIALKQDEATAINYDNITNCIVKIPKDISVSFSGAVVTIAKGSTLYYPNGAGVFSSVVLTADETCTLSGTGDFYVFRRNASGTSGYYPEVISNINSGTSTSSTSGVFYDTTANRIDWYSGGTRYDRLFSFPVCRVKVNSGSIVSIERVFNGFGYVGKKVYALPGVQGLAPNGRNSDGSLKNSIVNITNVVTNDAYNSKFTIKNNQILPCYYTNYAEQTEKPSFANGDWFNPAENIYYRITNSVASPDLYCKALDVIASGSGIQKATDINSKTVFRAVDYSEYAEADSQNVKLTGNQTISGTKSFSSGIVEVGKAKYQQGNIEFIPATTASFGGYIDFHYAGSTADYTSRIIEDASGQLKIAAPTGTILNTEPSESSNSGQVATTAFVNKVKNRNITNCITEIPQNINLTLSSGTLTLKAGSKIHMADGNLNTTTTISTDITRTSPYNGQFMLILYGNAIFNGFVDSCLSGAIANRPNSTAHNAGMYFATDENKIYVTSDSGATWTHAANMSMPLAIITVSGGAISSIDQVFNGFGYIGSTIFALPGVTLVKPNGRNTDGSLKNTISTTTSVRINSQVRPSTNGYLIYAPSNQNIQKSAAKRFWGYYENKNLVINSGGDTGWMIWGSYTTDSNDKIISFEPKFNFHAVDYNDFTTSKGFVVAAGESSGTGYTTWYRKYADGWVEQGGVVVKSMAATNTTYSWSQTLPVKMQGTMYTVNITSKSGWTLDNVCGLEGTTTTAVSGFLKTTGGTVPRDIYVYWRVAGEYAQ